MDRFEQLIRFESAGSALAFRIALYRPDEDASLIVDCLALANSDTEAQRRYIFLGVDDSSPGGRKLPGVRRRDLAGFKRRFTALVAQSIEPELSATVRAIEIDGKLIAYIRIKNCTQRPYLTSEPVGRELAAGVGYIRRGVHQGPLTRADLKRMFAAFEPPPDDPVTIRFAADQPGRKIRLPVLGIKQLPSQLASDRLRTLLEARNQSRDKFGQTVTRISRLMHVKLFGVEQPFERHSDDSLVGWIENADADYRSADDHYRFEVRAHKLNLLLHNNGDMPLQNAELMLSIDALPGFGVADRICLEGGAQYTGNGYPQVVTGGAATTVSVRLKSVVPGRDMQAFREPLRVWVREEAASQSVVVAYRFTADQLSQPLTGNLVISIEPA